MNSSKSSVVSHIEEGKKLRKMLLVIKPSKQELAIRSSTVEFLQHYLNFSTTRNTDTLKHSSQAISATTRIPESAVW